MKLIGGPCDGEKVYPFPHRFTVPLAGGEWARAGDRVTEVATYQIDITGTRAYYVGDTKQGKCDGARG